MSGFVTVGFRVRAEDAERMKKKSVYLDVFGNVRWTDTTEAVADSSNWAIINGPSFDGGLAVVGSTPEGQTP